MTLCAQDQKGARKVDELDICKLRACSFATVHRIVTELFSMKNKRNTFGIKDFDVRFSDFCYYLTYLNLNFVQLHY